MADGTYQTLATTKPCRSAPRAAIATAHSALPHLGVRAVDSAVGYLDAFFNGRGAFLRSHQPTVSLSTRLVSSATAGWRHLCSSQASTSTACGCDATMLISLLYTRVAK